MIYMKNIYLSILNFSGSGLKNLLSLIFTVFLLAIAPGKSMAQLPIIYVTNVATTSGCAGSSITITYNVKNGNFSLNKFTNSTQYRVYLSDGTGTSFSAVSGFFNNTSVPYATGNGATTYGLTQAFLLPSGIPSGTSYKIAIGSQFPLFNAIGGAGASGGFLVNALPPAPTISANGDTTFCIGGSVALTSSGGTSYLWSTGGTTQSINVTSSGSYTVRVTNASGCLSGPSAPIVVTANPFPAPVTVTGGGSICGSSTTLSASNGGSGTIYYQGAVSNDTSTATPSTSQVVNSPGTYYFRAEASGCWGTQGGAVVSFNNVWTGATNTDWNTGSNWSNGQVASTLCQDVYIPPAANQPIISSVVPAITNLNILTGASVTITGTGTLPIGGSISNSGIFNVGNGTLIFNGTSPQNIDGDLFSNRNLRNLTIDNNLNISGSPNDTLNILGTISFGNTYSGLTTGNNITLKSSDTATANVGILAPGNTITGNVTVERYIATGTIGVSYHAKSWQYLAIPTTGSQTIKAAWQEGASASDISSPSPGSPGNPNAGYGTMLTSDVANAASQPTPGFDDYTSIGPSIKIYNSAVGNYISPSSTSNPIYNPKGYLIFVRGDRSVTTANGPATPTILRTSGTLFSPANPPPVTNVASGTFESIGNPYASAIDVRNVAKTGGVNEFLYIWDPRVGSENGYGAFQEFLSSGDANNDYWVFPGGGSYPPFPTVYNFIQSGQAFLVNAPGGSGGTVSFSESCKANGSSLFTEPAFVSVSQGILNASINAINPDSSSSLLDGTLIMFDDNYSNLVDDMDARKIMNTGENLSIQNGNNLLAVERMQPITAQDTIFLNLTNVTARNYRFHFDASTLSAHLQAILLDNYLNTRIPINTNGSTDINFNIQSNVGSNASNRFKIIFSISSDLPGSITTLKAFEEGSGNIKAEWTIPIDQNIARYEVEKSNNGANFYPISFKSPLLNQGGSAKYEVEDANPFQGNNYYRIKTISANGAIAFSPVAKVFVENGKQGIIVYPNPVNGGTINLQFVNQLQGTYEILILNEMGQKITQKQISFAGGSGTEPIKWDNNPAHGMYQLEVVKPDRTRKVLEIKY
jgi:hypothetical protein